MARSRAAQLVAAWTAAACLEQVLAISRAPSRSDPYSHVGAQISAAGDGASSATLIPVTAGRSRKYLLASFPELRQVAYCHLPDNVWRPLVLGEVSEPREIAVDTQNARLFVSDPPNDVIWWYLLGLDSGGLLQTVGSRKAAVEGVKADWLTVNGIGDLYFTGRMLSSTSNHSGVFRQDASNLAAGRSLNAATEVYSRSNTGSPDPKAWVPSGIAVDSLFVYWGNGADGQSHGSVIKGSRTNIGLLSQDRQLKPLSYVADEVRGMTATGTHVFYLSPAGVHGVLKSAASPAREASMGLIAAAPAEAAPGAAAAAGGAAGSAREAGGVAPWSPAGISWDGDNLLYFTDAANGIVYSLPALNVLEHSLTKFADAPGVHGVSIIGFSSSHRSLASGPPVLAQLGAARAGASARLAAVLATLSALLLCSPGGAAS